jgi:hypothetical protein
MSAPDDWSKPAVQNELRPKRYLRPQKLRRAQQMNALMPDLIFRRDLDDSDIGSCIC